MSNEHDLRRPAGKPRTAGHCALLVTAAAAWCAFAFTHVAQSAEQVCVICEAPDAQYSCSFAPQAASSGPSGRGSSALKYRCIREVAQTYGHQRCKVNDTPMADCAGTVHMLAPLPAAAAGPASEAGGAAPGEAAESTPLTAGAETAGAETAGTDGVGEPKTVVELAKRTAKTTQQHIEKSSETVEDMARQAWRCVTSLFSNCDAAPAAPDGSRSPDAQ